MNRIENGKDILVNVRKSKRTVLMAHETNAFLSSYGFPMARSEVASSAEEAAVLASEIGFPVTLKVLSPEIIHKTDAQCVKLGLDHQKKVEDAYKEIMANARISHPKVDIQGALVQEMIDGGTEMIIGLASDPTFGKSIMFGLGGIWVEVMKDVSFRIVPLSRLDAKDMVEEIKGYPLLKGIRGGPPKDIDALCALLVQVSTLGQTIEEIRELDLNPVFAKEKGAVIADARIVIQE